ncbi:beta-1,6-N-acetylglucosaminyltransferase [Leuconostoc mesenteroides]
MVIGHGEDTSIIQETINILDDEDIDFFIHWDKRNTRPSLFSRYSTICLIDSKKVFWGTDSQIMAELHLMESVNESNITYDYVHLISSVDMPLMTSDYFKEYFTRDAYIGFVENIEPESLLRVKYYYPLRNVKLRNPYVFRILTSFFRNINKLFGINRIKKSGLEYERGSNWFSIKTALLPEIIESKNLKYFYHSYLADEMFVQTILSRFKFEEKNKFSLGDSAMALRYIDWNRGAPYLFNENDIPELKVNINKQYAFARKISDATIIKRVFCSKEKNTQLSE